MAIQHKIGLVSLVRTMILKLFSFGKLAAHVGNGISIWLVAVVINKDLIRSASSKQSIQLEEGSFLTPP